MYDSSTYTKTACKQYPVKKIKVYERSSLKQTFFAVFRHGWTSQTEDNNFKRLYDILKGSTWNISSGVRLTRGIPALSDAL